MMKLFVLFFLINMAWGSSREDAAALLRRFAVHSDTVNRMDKMSVVFLGLPYGDGGPLGEGRQGRYDQDPLYRFDTFDCTTYVETIVSLALSKNIDEFEHQMDKIRYDQSVVDYLTRNHFPSLQWIPFNVANGLLSEINDEIASKDEIRMASAVINISGWLKMIKLSEIKVPMASQREKQDLLEELHSKASLYSPLKANLNYIPMDYFLKNPENMKRIPNGSIVNFVRPNWNLTQSIGTHMNVSHQGLLFWKDDVLYLRHASTFADKQVAELPFVNYMKRFENHPTMKGVHFMKVN